MYLRSGTASLYHPATYYLAFHGLVFVFRPILNWYYGYEIVYRLYQFSPSEAERATALAAAHLGFVAFMTVVLRVANRPMRFAPPDPERYRWRKELVLASLICAPLGIYSLAVSVQGMPAMARDAATGIAYNTEASGYFTDANNMLAPIVVLLAWQFRFRWWAALPFVAYVLARMSVGWGRWTFVMAAASFAILFLYSRRRSLWPSWRVLTGAALILAAFVAAGQQRSVFQRLFSGETVELTRSGDAPLEGMDFANQEYLEYLVYVVPERSGTYGYFVSNLQLFTEPVPRILWPDKPIGPPIQYYQLFDYGFPIGMTNSLPGEGWQQAGYLGVIVWCALFGLVFGYFYRWFVSSRQTPLIVATYAMLLPLSVQFFRDGTLLTLFRFPLFYMIPIVLWALLIRVTRTRAGAAGEAPDGWRALTPAQRRAALAGRTADRA